MPHVSQTHEYANEARALADIELLARNLLKRIWWDTPPGERALLRCPFRGDVMWTQLPLEQAATDVVTANRERTARRRLKTPSPVSEAEITLLAGLRFYGENPLLQHPVGRYDLDFFIADYLAAIEVDGAQWHNPERDAKRDARVLRTHGISTYRIPARDALRDPLWAVRYTCGKIVRDRRSDRQRKAA